ncbi:MAG: carbamoyltransferase HypF [Anaerolineales bacterium]|nr:carbamoyltransferase HypF [Anaerolineales bacterium]
MNRHISVTGIVQGVGFRPFIYGLAKRLGLHGWVRNTSGGVEIVVQGNELQVERFVRSLKTEAPPLAKIDSISVRSDFSDTNFNTFNIQPSTFIEGAFQPVSPDVALCPDCERELFDPKDRRYLYPFINCTNCGPRFTIMTDLPYDRPATTMAEFEMCAECRAEYTDPANRRFHAQPVACPQCGPCVHLEVSPSQPQDLSTIDLRLAAILKTRKYLREGKIIAIKGIGGFHLACDAGNRMAVDELRRRKGRQGKPFALMAADLEMIRRHCEVNEAERELLTGREKPIVLLNKRETSTLPNDLAPGMDTLGVMLPYTPLHHLILNRSDPILNREPAPPILVMTSGNFSEEPIATDNQDALERLGPLADAFLLHNRDIHVRCDDSVVRVEGRRSKVESHATLNVKPSTFYLRRSRGYAPYPIHLPIETVPTLAVGGELKNTFCLARDRSAFLSHHIGDMENVETFHSFEQGVDHLSRLFRVKPELTACDMHPGYFTTKYAQGIANIPRIAVQHHHAHIASCLADNGLENRRVIGLAFDGTGYGTDGTIWGGEILLASYADFERFAHLEPLPLPGGDSAIRHPWRIAVGYAHALGIDIDDLPFLKNLDMLAVNIVRQQADRKLNAPLTSSMGRLFDAVASLAGIRNDVSYEAQAAIEMEVLSKPFLTAKPYPYSVDNSIPLKELLQSVVHDVRTGKPAGMIGARFHKTIAEIAVDVCKRARVETSLNEVALSGGVWQNELLLGFVSDGLEREGFIVYFHKQVPANDGGLALGQAVVANFIASREAAKQSPVGGSV